jgi:hypothetical protein
VDYVIDGFWLVCSRPSGAIRGKWRILDGNGESVIDHKFGAPMVVVPPVSIKDRVGCAPL